MDGNSAAASAESRPRGGPAQPRVLVLLLAGVAVVILAVILKLADSVREADVVTTVDRSCLHFVMSHRTAWLTRVARTVTVAASGWVVTPVVARTAVTALARRARVDALFVVVSSAGAAVLVAIVKHLVGRARPPISGRLVVAAGAAFPSGHAAQSIACYGSIAVVVAAHASSRAARLRAAAAAVAIALLIGLSRVYLGVHWLSDVVSGWLLAAGWLACLTALRVAAATSPRRRPPGPLFPSPAQ